MARKNSLGLRVITAEAMRKAIAEFNELGRVKFLKQYRFSRSSKFYLMYEQRLYDSKALVAAAFRHATGKRLANTEFGGGAQTKAVFSRLSKTDPKIATPFEDKFGELRNLSTEYDQVPDDYAGLRQLGFSKWIPIGEYKNLNTGRLPGVYVIAKSSRQPGKMPINDKRIVYVGETVEQDLRTRLDQFNRTISGGEGHAGGKTLRKKGFKRKGLWFAVRSFPLGYRLERGSAKSLRSAQIRHLERTLLSEYVRANQAYPIGNSK